MQSVSLPSANTKKSFTSQRGRLGLQWAVPLSGKARGFGDKDGGCFPSGFYFAFLLFLNLVNVDWVVNSHGIKKDKEVCEKFPSAPSHGSPL